MCWVDPPRAKPRGHALGAHQLGEIHGEGEGGAAGPRLEGEAVAHDPGLGAETRGELGDPPAVGALGDPRRPGDDLGRVADRVHLDDEVDVVALDLPGQAGEGHQVVGDHDDLFGVDRIGEGETEQPAGRRTVDAVGVAEEIGGGGGDDRHVDVDLAVLDRLPAAAVRPQDAEPAHLAGRTVGAQGSVHGAFDVVDDPLIEVADLVGVDRKGGRGKPHEVLDAEVGGGVEDHVAHRIAVAQVVVGRDHHAVGQARRLERLAKAPHPLVAVGRVVDTGRDPGRRLASIGPEAADPLKRHALAPVDLDRHQPPRRVLLQLHCHVRILPSSPH